MSIPFQKAKRFTEDTDILTFGAHHGKTISWLVQFEPEYLAWATAQPNLVYLRPRTLERLYDSIIKIQKEKAYQKTKKLSKEIYYVHADQDDWWEDIPF